MTYGVPYSFVPGTKAKADEVNANFVDVLEKISDSNSRITNLTNTIDGNWIFYSKKFAEVVSINGSTNLTFDLSNELPDDGEIYEVLLSSIGTSSSTGTQLNNCYISSDIVTDPICLFRNNSSKGLVFYAGGSCVFPVGTDRYVELIRSTEYSGLVTLYIRGYRKVR